MNLFSHPNAGPGGSDVRDFLFSHEPDYMNTGPTHFWGIRRYNRSTFSYEACQFSNPTPDQWSIVFSSIFPIISCESNVIYMINAKTLEFPIFPQNLPIDLKVGVNYIGLPYPPFRYTSYRMLQDIGGPEDVMRIASFDPLMGQWLNTYWEFNRPGGDNFFIRPGEGYLLLFSLSCKLSSFSDSAKHP